MSDRRKMEAGMIGLGRVLAALKCPIDKQHYETIVRAVLTAAGEIVPESFARKTVSESPSAAHWPT